MTRALEPHRWAREYASGEPRCPVQHGLDPFSDEFVRDPWPILEAVREQAPVVFSPDLNAYVVTRHEDVERVLGDPARFSSANVLDAAVPPAAEALAELPPHDTGPLAVLANNDGSDHDRIRRHCQASFTVRAVARYEPFIRERVAALLEPLPRHEPVDFVAALNAPLPGQVIFNMLGVPEADFDRLVAWSLERVRFGNSRLTVAEQVAAARAMRELWDYSVAHVERTLRDPSDDFTSALARIHLADPGAISVREIATVIWSQSAAGHATTTWALGAAQELLLRDRGVWERLCREPELMANAVEETLRLNPSGQVGRRVTTEPVEIAGVPIPAGAKIGLLNTTANRDPRRFDDPLTLDVERPRVRSHLTFGKGIHFCMGAPLARLELTVAMRELAARFPRIELAVDGPLEYPAQTQFRGPVVVPVILQPR